MSAPLRVFSFGGGTQSMAALVLASRGELQYDHFLFANVGNDSEYDESLVYQEEHAKPFAAAHGLSLLELDKRRKDGSVETVYRSLMRDNQSIAIPVRLERTGAPANRDCTVDFKIRVVARWLKRNGATAENPATVALGFSFDEWDRQVSESGFDHYGLEYPLITRRLRVDDCQRIILSAGLPIPPKSACWFCPLRRPVGWARMKRRRPDLFARSVELERVLNERRAAAGKGRIFFTDKLIPLDRAIGDQASFDDLVDGDDFGGGCVSGYCHT